MFKRLQRKCRTPKCRRFKLKSKYLSIALILMIVLIITFVGMIEYEHLAKLIGGTILYFNCCILLKLLKDQYDQENRNLIQRLNEEKAQQRTAGDNDDDDDVFEMTRVDHFDTLEMR